MDVSNSVIEACKRGDPQAFAELVRATTPGVYSLAFRISGNSEDAADIAQETYLKLLRTIKQFRGDSKFSTWLYRVTSTVAITHIRKRSRRSLDVPLETEDWNVLPAPASAGPVARTEEKELRDQLDAALQSLPAAYRAVVVMKDVYGFSLHEIGEQLQISEGAAKVRLFRARRRLRALLGDAGGNAAKEGMDDE